MQTRQQNIIQLMIAIAGVFIATYGLSLFNRHLLSAFPIGLRLVLMILTQWILFIVPGILMLKNRERLIDLDFSKSNLPAQIGIGIILALLMSLVFTILPILLGFKDMVGSTQYTKVWHFMYDFLYKIIGIALVEELIFRGYMFKKLLQIKDSKFLAIALSSIIFGLFHIFNNNIIQVIVTAFLGFIFCMFREKIKNCTTLSLVITHGIYDALIVLWVFIL